jgi:hypothetical protein
MADDSRVVRVKLTDGREFVVQATLDQFEKVLRAARLANAMVEIELPDQSIMPIDPTWILSFREESEAEARAKAEAEKLTAAAG